MKVILMLIAISLVSFITSKTVHHQLMDLISTKPLKDRFKLWHYALHKPYNLNSEYAIQRYIIFKENVKFIEEINNKNLGYSLGLGPFTDLSSDEFTKNFLSATQIVNDPRGLVVVNRKDLLNNTNNKVDFDTLADIVDKEENKSNFLKQSTNKVDFDSLADAIDNEDSGKSTKATSNKRGVVTGIKSPNWEYLFNFSPPKDQSNCKSCWAFATIGALEGMANKLLNTQILYSEMQLIDCITHDCIGGSLNNAFEYATKKGIASNKDYPWINSYHNYCLEDNIHPSIYIQSYKYCSGFCKEDEINDMINNGPYATNIHVDPSLAHYRDGNFIPNNCSQDKSNHGVAVVEISDTFVRIRNSWGPNWGQKGYGNISFLNQSGDKGCGSLHYGFQMTKLSLTDEK